MSIREKKAGDIPDIALGDDLIKNPGEADIPLLGLSGQFDQRG
jgi:hypothetical protein